MRFQINQATVSLGGKMILDHCSMEIRGKDKIAIVGANGSGKSTLLHLISGQLTPDQDDKSFQQGIWMARNTTIGILEQNPFSEKDITVDDIIEEISPFADPYSSGNIHFETEYKKMFTLFGFSMNDRRKKISDFSGGEQTKIALIRLLLEKPDILLLDEPTNHLDIKMIEWLEKYLKDYNKALVLVSHDRYFLDQIVTVVYELEGGSLKKYVGNYSDYRVQREHQNDILKKKYKEQQEEIEKLNELIRRFKHKPKKASMARSKKKILERMEKIAAPYSFTSYIYPGRIVPHHLSSKSVFECKNLQIGYDHSIHKINLRIKRGQKIAIMGPNGSGKSTFLKTLSKKIPPYSGQVIEGNNLDMSYYDQFSSEMDGHLRLLEDFHNDYPSYSLGDCRKILANYLFKNEDVHKELSSLSGGEKSRYAIAKMLESRPNVLLLDEPTNHLDIPAKEILESAFRQYEGTILFVSHDRYFLSSLADSLLIFDQDRITYFPYDYRTYVASKEKEEHRRLQGIRDVEEENAILTRSLENVPKKEKIQAPRFSTEQSYCDWQLELISTELEKLSYQLETIYDRVRPDQSAMIQLYYDDFAIDLKEYMERLEQYEKILEEYTECCIRWYEKWLDYEEEFSTYHD